MRLLALVLEDSGKRTNSIHKYLGYCWQWPDRWRRNLVTDISSSVHMQVKKSPCNGIFINVEYLFCGSCVMKKKKNYLKQQAHTHTDTHTYILYSIYVLSHSYLGGWLEQPLSLGAVHDTTQSLTDCRNGFHLILIWCIYEPNSPPPLSHVPL